MFTRSIVLAGMTSFAITVLAAGQSVGGEKWRVTTSMEMIGMSMPGQTQEICKQPGDDTPAVSDDKDCSITNVKRTGNQVSMNMHCTGERKADGTLLLTYLSQDHYTGDMKMQVEGRAMTMKFEGQKLGSCDGKEANIQAQKMGDKVKSQLQQYKQQSDAQMAAMCTQMAKDARTNVGAFAKACSSPSDKAAFCTTFKSHDGFTAQSELQQSYAQNPEGVSNAEGTHPLDDGAAYCGTSVVALKGSLCSTAEQAGKLGFLADNCEAEAQKLAMAQCAGRRYTSDIAPKYQQFCSAYASKMARTNDGNDASKQSADKPADKPGIKDKAKGALKSLGGLFGG